jgi:hypothetical protein
MCCREDEGKAASELALVVFVVVVGGGGRKEGRKNVENIAMATYTTHSQRSSNALST